MQENGCWHDTELEITRADGLNQSEVAALLARTMARVEVIRELEFQASVPVTTITRDQYNERATRRFDSYSQAERLSRNVKWEALLMVNETTDVVELTKESTVQAASGFYSPAENQIYLISNGSQQATMDERLIGHELVHVLQTQHFNVAERFDIANFGERTIESQNRLNGLLEGDAELVWHRYHDRCDIDWECVVPTSETDLTAIHSGLNAIRGFPYNAGPRFVNRTYSTEGWEGVNEMYEQPPESTEVVIHPEKYGTEESDNISFTDRSTSAWEPIGQPDGEIRYGSVGQPGIAVMLFYPFWETDTIRAPVIPRRSFFKITETGELSLFYPLKYGAHDAFRGWDGDRIYPYVNRETDETGYVWQINWDTQEDRDQFRERYEQLLSFYEAEPVPDREHTYRIPSGNDYSGVYHIEQTETTMYIVHAPDVAQLSEIRDGAASSDSSGGPLALLFRIEIAALVVLLSLSAVLVVVVGRSRS